MAGGLYLQVTPSGGKHCHWRYEIEGKEKTYTIGSYPDVRLPEAQSERDEARKVLQAGRDPAKEKKLLKTISKVDPTQTFIATARDWFAQRKDLWTERHAADVWRSLERDVLTSNRCETSATGYPRSVICATASRLNSSLKLGFPINASCPHF